MEKKNKTVFVIVRETQEIKERLELQSLDKGFKTLSDYVRDMWSKWL